MALSYSAENASDMLPVLLKDLLSYGEEVGSRNGLAKELLNVQICLSTPQRREILSLNRNPNVFAQIAETMWVLAGRNDIGWLSAYLPRAADYSDDGKTWRAGYGKRIRKTPEDHDQLVRVVEILKADPLSRQAVIQIWNADEDLDLGPIKDRACNTQIQFLSRGGDLHMTVTVRSNDVMWGWSGINAFEWSTMQEIVARLLGIGVGDLTFNIGSLHLYAAHWGKARNITRDALAFESKIISFDPEHRIHTVSDLDSDINRWFGWEMKCREGDVSPESLREYVEDPLFRAWGAAIAYYWTQDEKWLDWFHGTGLATAVARTPRSLFPEPVQKPLGVRGTQLAQSIVSDATQAFYDAVCDLHEMKDRSYQGSWKKRGEQMSILANMARKVDRIGVADDDDTSADTVIDLLVYSIKYLGWLCDEDDTVPVFNRALWQACLNYGLNSVPSNWDDKIRITFDTYADNLDLYNQNYKREFMIDMIEYITPIAIKLWVEEQNPVDEYRGADHE